MDIHKPKPIHNLREFLGEIAVIIIGVLIALGLEQAVEAWHWRHQVETTEQALRAELLDAYGGAAIRIAVSDCIDRRLDEISALVDEGATTGRLPPIGRPGNAPGWLWSESAWESALAGQTAEHLNGDRRRAYGDLYALVTRLRDDNQREIEAWNALYTLVGPGRSVTPAEIAGWRIDIGRARLQNGAMGLSSVRFQQLIDSSPIAKERRLHETLKPSGASLLTCRPIGPALAHYGNASIVDAIAYARKTPIRSNFPPE